MTSSQFKFCLQKLQKALYQTWHLLNNMIKSHNLYFRLLKDMILDNFWNNFWDFIRPSNPFSLHYDNTRGDLPQHLQSILDSVKDRQQFTSEERAQFQLSLWTCTDRWLNTAAEANVVCPALEKPESETPMICVDETNDDNILTYWLLM